MEIAIRSYGADEVRSFRRGDTVRAEDNDDNCVVIGIWRDWLWLDPIDYDGATPFAAPARDYQLVRRGFS